MNRTIYGYPDAHAYAAAARERNKPECDCANCQHINKLPAVQRIVASSLPYEEPSFLAERMLNSEVPTLDELRDA